MESKKASFLKNMIGFSMVTWISFVLGFLSSPIATRLFVPEELGKVNMFFSYSGLMSAVCYLGLDQMFIRFFLNPPSKASRKTLFTYAIGVSLAASLLLTLCLTAFWQRLSIGVSGAPSVGIFVCLCVYSFSLIMFRFLSLCYRMEQNALLYTIQGILQVFITKLAYLSVAFAGGTGEHAILLLTLLMSLFSLTFLVLQRRFFSVKALAQVDKPFLKETWKFALPLVPLTLLDWLNNNVSVVVLNNLLGLGAVAVFSSAVGLASTINIIQTGFNTYWAPYVLENYDSQDGRFYTVHRLMACMLTLFGLGISLLQTPVFLLLGKSYRSSVIFFPFLFLSPICYCLGETTDMGITIAKKTYWTTLIFLISSLLNIALCYVFIPRFGMVGGAMASAGSAIVILFLRTAIGQKYYRVLPDWRYLFITVGLMLAASFGNLLLNDLPLPKYLLLTGLVALACLIYRNELKTLFSTGWELAGILLGKLKRRKNEEESNG
ncbi:MAG: lipopolysaccharide biosynthesis protein [Clostridiales bacterium]|nr:lipopolysaccharide biosynthesis protein [Clostridiales bacterium]